MFKSIVYHASSPIGEVEVYPKNTNLITPVREIRISHLTAPSERCPPLGVLHAVGSGGVCFKMQCRDESSLLVAMHIACLTENKTAVIPIGDEEIHLVAMKPQQNLKIKASFWGFRIGGGMYNSCLNMLNTRCLAIVFDLDETLIVANTSRSYEDRIDSLQRKISNEPDPQRISAMLSEIKRYKEDKDILKQYAESDQVTDNGKVYNVQSEVVPRLSDVYPLMTRPVIRLPDRGIVLTRINPSIRDTSVLVKMRPAWEELRSYLTARGRKRFEVFVCTMAERDYALEMWRLLDPDFNLISSQQLLDRIVCVKAGLKKSLKGVFQDGCCHPSMALVIDDRLKVWDEKDQFRVHVVPAFAPYYAPQAEASNTIPILCVARNVACNVRGGFFREFDDGLLPRIGEVCYEDEFSDFPSAPDVGNYLISEDENTVSNGNKELVPFDGMADAEVERRLKEATSSAAQSARPIPPVMSPPVVPFPQVPPAGALPEPSGTREEGEVPESELDPDTRRRLLILQHGQDTRDSSPPFPPAVHVPVPANRGLPPVPALTNRGPPPPVPVLTSRGPPPAVPVSTNRGPAPAVPVLTNRGPPPDVAGAGFPPPPFAQPQPRFLPPQVPHGDERMRQSNGPSNYRRSTGWDQPPPNLDTPVGALQNIAMKCGSKVEFRSVLCDTAELQFSVEAWLVGEKIGEGIGRTRKEAQLKAAEISLKNLSNQYVSGSLSDAEKLSRENGGVNNGPNMFGYNNINNNLKEDYNNNDNNNSFPSTSDDSRYMDPRNPNLRRIIPPSISSLRELCMIEGFSLNFKPEMNPSDGSGVYAQVEIAGQILGKGVGATWEDAKLQAANEAHGNLKSMLGQFTQNKRSNSPRSLGAIPNKRMKPDFSRQLQRIPSSSR